MTKRHYGNIPADINERVTRALQRRGLEPNFDDLWLVHPPHGFETHPTAVGWCHDADGQAHLVAIRRSGVSEITSGNAADGQNKRALRRIPDPAGRHVGRNYRYAMKPAGR